MTTLTDARTADAAPVVDVAIVGLGPVGATLAILLGQLGRSVVVLERWPEPYPLPRAVHLDHEVARILQSCGLGAELEAVSEPAPIYEWRNGAGVPLLRIGRHGDSPSAWPESLMFHQPTLEAILDRRARSLDAVEVRRGVEVTGLDQGAEGVTVATADGGTLRARYVVGCDGANSTVRTLLDVPMVDLGFFYDWLVVDVVLHEPRVFDPVNLQVCDPFRPTTLVSGGPGRRRWEFMRLPEEPAEALTTAARAWELLDPWDVRPDNATLERQAVYTFHARHAARWRDGRVLLAGDAAHQTPPFAGQGMCAGIRDAADLAWQLDLVLGDHSPDALLDAYQAERLPGTRQLIQFAMDLGRIICVPDPDEAAARDDLMAPDVGPDPTPAPPLRPIDAGIVAPDTAQAGHLFVQGRGPDGRTDDVDGAGWRLVLHPTCDALLDDRTAGWFASIGGRVVTGRSDTHLGWFGEHGCTAALQRPDFHVFGTATDAPGAANLVARLRNLLEHPPRSTP